jgi:chorismate mutase
MSPSSRISNLAQYREALAHLNSEFLLTISERRGLCLKIQEFKETQGTYSHYDPVREKEVFDLLNPNFKELSLKELLAFSLIMEDQAMAMAPGSYPSWSQGIHLIESNRDLVEMINPLLLKVSRPDLFSKLNLSIEFNFLKDF